MDGFNSSEGESSRYEYTKALGFLGFYFFLPYILVFSPTITIRKVAIEKHKDSVCMKLSVFGIHFLCIYIPSFSCLLPSCLASCYYYSMSVLFVFHAVLLALPSSPLLFPAGSLLPFPEFTSSLVFLRAFVFVAVLVYCCVFGLSFILLILSFLLLDFTCLLLLS